MSNDDVVVDDEADLIRERMRTLLMPSIIVYLNEVHTILLRTCWRHANTPITVHCTH